MLPIPLPAWPRPLRRGGELPSINELGRVYRLARRGEMKMEEAKGYTYVLREIRCALEAGDVERRLEELEGVISPELLEPWRRRVAGVTSHETH